MTTSRTISRSERTPRLCTSCPCCKLLPIRPRSIPVRSIVSTLIGVEPSLPFQLPPSTAPRPQPLQAARDQPLPTPPALLGLAHPSPLVPPSTGMQQATPGPVALGGSSTPRRLNFLPQGLSPVDRVMLEAEAVLDLSMAARERNAAAAAKRTTPQQPVAPSDGLVLVSVPARPGSAGRRAGGPATPPADSPSAAAVSQVAQSESARKAAAQGSYRSEFQKRSAAKGIAAASPPPPPPPPPPALMRPAASASSTNQKKTAPLVAAPQVPAPTAAAARSAPSPMTTAAASSGSTAATAPKPTAVAAAAPKASAPSPSPLPVRELTYGPAAPLSPNPVTPARALVPALAPVATPVRTAGGLLCTSCAGPDHRCPPSCLPRVPLACMRIPGPRSLPPGGCCPSPCSSLYSWP